MKTYIYDVECYPNLFQVGFIPLDAPQQFIDMYIRADIAGDSNAKALFLKAMGWKSFIIYKDPTGNTFKDDRRLIADFFESHKILYGYNSNEYDSIMCDYLLHHMKFYNPKGIGKNGAHITQDLHDLSSSVIRYGKGFRYTLTWYKYYRRPYTNRDIQAILYLDKSFTGLKKIAINLRWYRLEELPISPYTILTWDQVIQIQDYNVNDLLITRELTRNQKDELLIRDSGSVEFKIDLTNKSRSSIGKALFIKYYSDITKIPVKEFIDLRTNRYTIKVAPLLDPNIKFKTKQFQNLLDKVRASTIYITSDKKKADWGFTLTYNGTKYIIAKGGLHSKDDARIYDIVGNLDVIMRDADVASFYPRIILNLLISPAHLESYAFLAILDFVTTSRLKAKQQSQDKSLTQEERDSHKKKAEIYKIVINRIYGAFKDAFDPLYDPNCTYKTTINGQLYLMMLVERLELEGIHVISANTDGIVAKFDKCLEGTYNRICTEWEREFKFELEFTDYEKYVRFNVNEYLAIKKGFTEDITFEKVISNDFRKTREKLIKKYVKQKGLFISNPDFTKGFINPVVSIALNDYYLFDDRILDTFKYVLEKPNGIYEFCITQKVDKKFDVQYHHIVKGELVKDSLQQYNRFYVCSKASGNILKYNPDNGRYTSIVAKQNLKLLNVYKGQPIDDVNYSYYAQECFKIMNGSKNQDGISTLRVEFEFDDDIPEIIDVYDDYSYLYEKEDAFGEELYVPIDVDFEADRMNYDANMSGSDSRDYSSKMFDEDLPF